MMNKKLFFIIYALVIAFSTFSGVLIYREYASLIYVLSVFAFFIIGALYGHGSRGLKIGSAEIAMFVAICVVSILINQPPSYFRVWERLALLLVSFLAFSPLVVGNVLNRNRTLLFEALVKVMLVFSVASFIGYFSV